MQVELPVETTSQRSFIQHYCESILALQALVRKDALDEYGLKSSLTIPLAIMTSGDTDQLTKDLMKKNNNFGLAKDQVSMHWELI